MTDNEHRLGEIAVQFASVELHGLQYREENGKYCRELIGFVNFNELEFPTEFGRLRVALNRAKLLIEFQQCNMSQGDAGYRRQIREQIDVDRSTREKSESTSSGESEFSIDTGNVNIFGFRMGAGWQKSKNRENEQRFSDPKRMNLVTFDQISLDTGEVVWAIRDPNGEALIGQVIGNTDSAGGRLGTVKSNLPFGWKAVPRLVFEPSAEVIQDASFVELHKARIKKMLRRGDPRVGIVSAILGKTLTHKELPPLEILDGEQS
jgi:hypothetical protein